MNRRQRKKKHVGEFDYKGFEFEVLFKTEKQDHELEKIVDDLISYVESIDLGVGGGANRTSIGFFATKHLPTRPNSIGKMYYKNAHCTDSDRNKVESWLRSRLPLDVVKVGLLVSSTTGK